MHYIVSHFYGYAIRNNRNCIYTHRLISLRYVQSISKLNNIKINAQNDLFMHSFLGSQRDRHLAKPKIKHFDSKDTFYYYLKVQNCDNEATHLEK